MGNIKEELRDSFNVEDLGEICSFLGKQHERRNDVIETSQSMCLKNILKKSDMENCRPRATPCETDLSSCYKDKANDDVINEIEYREMVGG